MNGSGRSGRSGRFRMTLGALGAIGAALDRLMSDPGARPPRIKTGTVQVESRAAFEPAVVIQGDLMLPADHPGVPASRVRALAGGIEERWSPVPADLEHLSIAEVAKLTSTGQVPIAGWRVSYHRLRRGVDFDAMTGEEIRAHVLSLSIAPEDDALYNGYYATIKGNDVAHHDPRKRGMEAFRGGPVLKGHATFDENGRMTHDGTIRGGTEITGGRAEYRRKTKGYEPMDAGYFKHVEHIRNSQQAERNAKRDLELEKRDAKLPRKIGEL